MSKNRKHRSRKPPKGNYHPNGERQPLNLTGEIKVSYEIDRLRRQAKKAGVPELLAPDEAAYATMPKGNVAAARHLLGVMKLGATPFIDPASVFDLVHLAMAVHFGIDLTDNEYIPDGEQLDWLTNLSERCGLDLDTTDGKLFFAPSTSALQQYKRVSLLAVKRIALVESSPSTSHIDNSRSDAGKENRS